MIEVNITAIDMRVYFYFIWQGLGSGGSFCQKGSEIHLCWTLLTPKWPHHWPKAAFSAKLVMSLQKQFKKGTKNTIAAVREEWEKM